VRRCECTVTNRPDFFRTVLILSYLWRRAGLRVGPRHWRLEKYCWNYSVLSIIRANGGVGDAWIIEKHE
jgi:hypothetical protein